MGGVLLGFALGAMSFTSQGREIGNKLGDAVIAQAKRVISNATGKKPPEQSAGTSGDDRYFG